MKVALRVLTALNEKQTPNPQDLAELGRLAPLLNGLPPDELACEVIQLALKHRAEVRSKSKT